MNGKVWLITVFECALHDAIETPGSYLNIFWKDFCKPNVRGFTSFKDFFSIFT